MQRLRLNKHINILRGLAWEFHRSTGHEWDDLFSEAFVAYVRALETFNNDGGARLTSWIYIKIKHALQVYCRQQRYQGDRMEECEALYLDERSPETLLIFKELLCNLSEDTATICRIVLEAPIKFISIPPKLARAKLMGILRGRGWTWDRIWCSFREIKKALK
jgi:hypothetical protein